MSVKVTLNCQVRENQFGDLHTFLEDNLSNVRNFRGCHEVSVFFDHVNYELILDETWEDIQHHRDYILFITENNIMSQLVSFFKSPPTVKYFNLVNI